MLLVEKLYTTRLTIIMHLTQKIM